jgi:hypothetical protein
MKHYTAHDGGRTISITNHGGAGVPGECQGSGWRFRPFLVKSHDPATTVMGCMMFHTCTTSSSSHRQISSIYRNIAHTNNLRILFPDPLFFRQRQGDEWHPLKILLSESDKEYFSKPTKRLQSKELKKYFIRERKRETALSRQQPRSPRNHHLVERRSAISSLRPAAILFYVSIYTTRTLKPATTIKY